MSLKHAILVLLETEPGSGYDLLKQFKEGLGYFWNASHQQIYQQLKVLLEQDFISCNNIKQTDKPDKKVYDITAKGVEELKQWLSAQVKPNKTNDALLVKVFGGHLIDQNNLLEEIEAHQALHQKTLQSLLSIEQSHLSLPPEKQANYKLPYLTLRRGIIGEQAWLSWA
ncbi:hypothetical protein A3741_29415, partial [Oleiphilus sp. HI0069]